MHPFAPISMELDVDQRATQPERCCNIYPFFSPTPCHNKRSGSHSDSRVFFVGDAAFNDATSTFYFFFCFLFDFAAPFCSLLDPAFLKEETAQQYKTKETSPLDTLKSFTQEIHLLSSFGRFLWMKDDHFLLFTVRDFNDITCRSKHVPV